MSLPILFVVPTLAAMFPVGFPSAAATATATATATAADNRGFTQSWIAYVPRRSSPPRQRYSYYMVIIGGTEATSNTCARFSAVGDVV